jgi:hypothetical protein
VTLKGFSKEYHFRVIKWRSAWKVVGRKTFDESNPLRIVIRPNCFDGFIKISHTAINFNLLEKRVIGICCSFFVIKQWDAIV